MMYFKVCNKFLIHTCKKYLHKLLGHNRSIQMSWQCKKRLRWVFLAIFSVQGCKNYLSIVFWTVFATLAAWQLFFWNRIRSAIKYIFHTRLSHVTECMVHWDYAICSQLHNALVFYSCTALPPACTLNTYCKITGSKLTCRDDWKTRW